MNEVLNKALLDLQDALGEIDNWASLIQENQQAAADVMDNAGKTLQEVVTLTTSLDKATQKTLTSFTKRTDKVLAEVEALLMQYRQLATVTAELVDYLRSVNFPARLDKIDASVAAITLGVQNLSDKLDRRLDHLTGALEKGFEENSSRIDALQDQIQAMQERQDTYFWVTASMLFLALILLFVLLI